MFADRAKIYINQGRAATVLSLSDVNLSYLKEVLMAEMEAKAET